MFGRAWRLGRIGGIEIRIDPSWTVVALLVVYSLFLQFTLTYGGLSDPAGIALAVGATLLFFGSVLAHEMTHAILARRAGIPVADITLFIFGGTTRANVESHGPSAEFVVSAVGPLSSVVLAGLFWIASILGHSVLPHPVEGALGYPLVSLAADTTVRCRRRLPDARGPGRLSRRGRRSHGRVHHGPHGSHGSAG
jgi:Zn-dependent protease